MNIERANRIMGWMKVPELRWLAKQATTHKVIVEIGSFEGRSTRALADFTDGFVVCIDPWQYKMKRKAQSFERFQINLADHIESGRVVYIRARSDECLSPLTLALGIYTPDMVFIDGNHEYEAVAHDIKLAKGLLGPGGLLCGHDYHPPKTPGVTKAVDELVGPVNLVQSIWWVTV